MKITLEQVTHYYPYGPRSHRESIFMLSARRRGFSRGQVIGDISTNENLQKFKFEGKVLAAIEKIDNLRREDEPLGEGKDRSFGLDNYDIHARNYFAMLSMWDRPDSKAQDYYWISPYIYCGGNPVNFGDYDGMNPIYDKDGNYLGNTIEGFIGVILISHDQDFDITQVSVMTAEELLNNEAFFVNEEKGLTAQGLEKVWNHILEHFDGLEISDGLYFSTEESGKIRYSFENTAFSKGGGDYAAWKTYMDSGNIYGSGGYDYETTVENIASAIIFHEYYGHAVMKWGDSDNTHYKCYEAVKNSSLYKNTTERFQNRNTKGLNKK